MERAIHRMPRFFTFSIALLMLLYGPIPQPADYHHFADGRPWSGLINAADVLSNIGFALVGAWGLAALSRIRTHAAIEDGWPGYRLFLWALIATSAGSAWYHLHPDNMRLVWDRLPIALACAGLLSGVYLETKKHEAMPGAIMLLALAAVSSVGWWIAGEQNGNGDLRPYLLMQVLPLVLIPMWQKIHGATQADRRTFLIAIALYIAAKVAEMQDHQMLVLSGWISGHTVKHLLATAAAAVITARLVARTRTAGESCETSTVTRPLRHRCPAREFCE